MPISTTKALSWLFLLLAVSLAASVPGLGQTITGTVFRDFNSDGAYTSTPTSGTYAYGEPGVGGVTIKAYNASGSVVTSTTSSTLAASLGSYTLNVGNTNAYRIEFTGFIGPDYEGFHGTGNATSIQFVNGGATNVNFGLNYPADYCQSTSPQLITSCFVATDAVNAVASVKARPATVSVSYTVVETSKVVTDYATVGEVGAVWGIAYDNTRNNNRLFSAAFTKRHVGFAAGGPNAIYVTNVTSATSGNTTEFFNFTTVGSSAVTSTTEAHGTDLPTSTSVASHDNAAFDAVGKTSLGGMDLSDDNQSLFVVNLKDRNLYKINTADKSYTSIAIPNPGCTTSGTVVNGSYRPFAVKYYRDKVYVGVVCTREDLGSTTATYGSTAGLSATVYAIDPTALSSFTTVLSFPLTYQKAPTNADKTGQSRAEYWRPWTSVFQTDRSDGVLSYPQAWLTDIEFEPATGDMILGVRDRYGDQMGYQNYLPFTSSTTLYSAITPGEILRARKCNVTDVQWSIENGGSLCGSTASSAQSATAGPGQGKYYWGDEVQNASNHGLSSQGGISQLPGSAKVAMTAIDPLDIFNTGGIKRLINATGAKDGNATYVSSTTNVAAGAELYTSDALGYGKANGLGGLTLMCNLAPVQIGNRVWLDSNNNGIQDPGENPLAGVRVTLSGPGLASPVSVTTNASGEYYFSNATGTNVLGSVYSLTGLTSGSSYTLAFPTSFSTASLSTKPNSATGTNTDNIDTDPNAVGLVTFTLGQAGVNNFSFDAGYAPCVPPSLTLTAIPSAICQGQTVALITTVSPADNYTYVVSGPVGVSLTGANTATAIATNLPTGVNNFTVTVYSSPVCLVTSTASVTVSTTPLINLTPSSSTICAGQSVQLDVAGIPIGGLLTFSELGPLGNVINTFTSNVVSPTATTTYLATVVVPIVGSVLGSCPVTITVNPALTLPALSLSLCVGTTIDPGNLSGLGGSLTALSGLTNVLRLGNVLGSGSILSTPISVSAGVNLFNVTSTTPLGCTATTPVTVTGINGPTLPALNLSLCVGTTIDPANLSGLGGNLTALSGLTNVLRLGNVLGSGSILSAPVSVSAGINLFNVTSTNPLGCTTTAPIAITGVEAPILPPLNLSLCVGTNLDLSELVSPTGSLSALSGLTNVFRLGNLVTGQILTAPVSISAGVNLFNLTSTTPLGCTTTTAISVTGVEAPILPPLTLSLCVGTNLDLSELVSPTGSLSALSGLTNVFRLGNLITGQILTAPVSISAGVNLFNLTSTTPLGCTTTTAISVTGVEAPILPPLTLSLCVGTNLDLSELVSPTGSLSALSGLTNVFRLGNLITGQILTAPVSISAGVNLFNLTSTTPLGCTTTTAISVTGVEAPILPPLNLSLCVGTNLDLSELVSPTGSLSTLTGLTNVFRLGNLITGQILTAPVSISAGVNLFNLTSTTPLGCTTTTAISVTGVEAPILPPLTLSLCVGTNLDLSELVSPTGSLSALSGLTNVFRLGNLITGQILTAPVSISAGVNLFNLTSTTPLGCTTTTAISVTGVEAPLLPPLNLSLCVGTNLDLSELVSPTGSLSALSGLTNVFRLGNLVTGQILTAPVSISAGVNLFNLTSTTPLGCTTTTAISVTGVEAPLLPPLNLSLCVGTNLDLSELVSPTGSLSALSGLTNVFRLGNLITGQILTGPVSISAGVNLFNLTSTTPLGCTTTTAISVTGVEAPILPPLTLSLCVGTSLDLSELVSPTGSLSALSGLTNVFRLGNLITGQILTGPVSISAGVNLFNLTSTTPLGCTTTTAISVTGVEAPILPPLTLSLCVGTNLDLSELVSPTGSLSALSGLTNVFRLGNLITGQILTGPVSISAGVNLFNLTSTTPLGCTTTTAISVTGVEAPLLPPLNLSLCVGTNLDLSELVSPTGSLSALSGLTNVFRLGNLVTGQILTGPVSISAGVNLFNLTSTTPLGCTTTTAISVTGVEAPILPPLNLSLCVGTSLDLSELVSPTGSLSALSGLTNVFRLGNLVTGQILTAPVSISAGVNLFNLTSTTPLGCTTTTAISVTGVEAPILPPLTLSLCVGTNLDLSELVSPTGSLSALSGLTNVFRLGNLITGQILTGPVSISAGVNLFNLTSTTPLGCTTTTAISVTGVEAPILPPLNLSLCVGTNLDLSELVSPTGSLSALSGLTNVFRLGNLITGQILTAPVSISAGVNLFNLTSTTPLGCTTTTAISVTGVEAPILPPLNLSLCVGTNLDLSELVSPTGSLSALNGLTNVFRLGNLITGQILTAPVSISAGVNLFNLTSTTPLGCTTTTAISVTGVEAPLLPPLNLSLCVGTNLDLSELVSPTGSLSALSGLTNVFRLGNLITGQILTAPVSISAGVNLFNLTSTTPLGCTTTTAISVTGVEAPILPPLNLSLCVGTNLDLSELVSPTGSLSALSGLTNVFRLGNLITGQILTAPVSISAGVNLFNLTSTNPLGCTTTTAISVTGVEAPLLPPLNLSLCVGTNLDLSELVSPTGSLSALSGLTNVFRLGNLITGQILTAPVSISAGVNLFNLTSTTPLGCTTTTAISVTGVEAPILPPLNLTLSAGTSLDLTTLISPTGALSALVGLTNVITAGVQVITTPVSITVGVNLFDVTSTTPLGCTTTTPIIIIGTPNPAVNIAVTPGDCQTATNQYSVTGTLSLTNAVDGVATITDGINSTTVVITAGATSVPYALSGLVSGTGAHTIVVSYATKSASTTYAAPSSCLLAQLQVEKLVDKATAQQGQVLTYTLVVSNVGNGDASNITVRDSTSGGLSYVSGSVTTPAGTTFTPGNPVSFWNIASLTAGQSLSLTFQAKADSSGILYNVATIPGDTAKACTSVPVKVCQGSDYLFELSVAPGRSSYQWYKDGVEIVGATTNVLSVTAAGTYSLVTNGGSGQCSDFSCCPFIVEEDTLPTFQAVAVPVTCIGNTAQANGQIVLSQFRTGYTYQYSLGNTFDAGASLSGAAQAIPTDGIIANNLTNPVTTQLYTVRVYNGSGCYQDVTVMLTPTTCACPASVCVPLVIRQTKGPKRTGL